MDEETRIQQEIGQTRPFISTAQAATASLLRTASVVSRAFDELAQREGLATQQYNVLRVLRGAGGRLPTMEIADRLLEQTPGVTRLVDRLEEKGFLTRERCSEDRRRVYCNITPEGMTVLRRLDEPMDRLDNEGMSRVGEADLQTLLRLLEEVRTGFREASGAVQNDDGQM